MKVFFIENLFMCLNSGLSIILHLPSVADQLCSRWPDPGCFDTLKRLSRLCQFCPRLSRQRVSTLHVVSFLERKYDCHSSKGISERDRLFTQFSFSQVLRFRYSCSCFELRVAETKLEVIKTTNQM